MIFLVLEHKSNVISSFEEALRQKFNASSIKVIGRDGINKTDIHTYANPPLFSNAWLLIVDPAAKSSIKYLNPEKNVILVKVTDRGQADELMKFLEGTKYRFVDNYNVEKDSVIEWIKKTLTVDDVVAKQIYNRANGRLQNVVNGVNALAVLPRFGRTEINNLVEKPYSVNIYNLTEWLLGVSTNTSYNDLLQFLWDFRYATRWMRKKLCEELNCYLAVFEAYNSGNLTSHNVEEFMRLNSDNRLKHVKEFKIRKIIDHHEVLSSEKVNYLYVTIKNMSYKDDFILKLLKLVKAGGNNVYSL